MAGNIENSTFYLMEAAAANLALFQARQAYEQLREVNRIYREARSGRNPFEGKVAQTDAWKPDDNDVGQMETLVGQALLQMNEPKKAVPHLRRAIRLLGCPQPKTRFKVRARLHSPKGFVLFLGDHNQANGTRALCVRAPRNVRDGEDRKIEVKSR